MSKLLTPQEALQAIADGKKLEYKWRNEAGWRIFNPLQNAACIESILKGDCIFHPVQEMITVGDVSFPKPVSEPLADGTKYWLVSLSYQPYAYKWSNAECDNLYLRMGLVHLSKENAVAHAKALIKLSGGKVDE